MDLWLKAVIAVILTVLNNVNGLHPDISCAACRLMIHEINYAVSEADPGETMEVETSRLDARGNRIKQTIPYALSSAHLKKVFQTACRELEDYGETTEPVFGKKSLARTMPRPGKPLIMQDTTRDHKQHLEMIKLCQRLVKDHERALISLFKKTDYPHIDKRLCVYLAKLCTSADMENPLRITEYSIAEFKKRQQAGVDMSAKPVRKSTKRKRKRRKGREGKEGKNDKDIEASQTAGRRQGDSPKGSSARDYTCGMDRGNGYGGKSDYGNTFREMVRSNGPMSAEDGSNTCSKPPIETKGKPLYDVPRMYGQNEDVKKDRLPREAKHDCTTAKDRVAGKDRVVEPKVKNQCSQKGEHSNENSRGPKVHKEKHFKHRQGQFNRGGEGKGGNGHRKGVKKEDKSVEETNFDTVFDECLQKGTPNADTLSVELVRDCVQQTWERGVYDSSRVTAALRKLRDDGRLRDPRAQAREERAKHQESIRNRSGNGRGREGYVAAEQRLKEGDLKKTGSDRKNANPVNIDKVTQPQRGDTRQTAKAREDNSVKTVKEAEEEWLNHCLEEGTKNTNRPLGEVLEHCVKRKRLMDSLEQFSEKHLKHTKSNDVDRKPRQKPKESKRNQRIRHVKVM